MNNPYQPPGVVEARDSIDNRGGTLLRGGFLYREIDFHTPVKMQFYYSGWNFVQRIRVNQETVWSRISWITIHRQAEFMLPESVDPLGRTCEMQITFVRGLRMRRFLLRLEGQVIWDDGGDRVIRGKPGWNQSYDPTL